MLLAKPAVQYPSALSTSARVSTRSGRKSIFWMAPCIDGYSDVRMDAIDGRVHDACEYVRAKATPSCAKLAKAGVVPAGGPNGSIASDRKVSTTTRIKFGLLV